MSRPSGSRHCATRRPYRSMSRTAQRRRFPEIKLRSVEVPAEPPRWFHSGASRPQTRIRRDWPLRVKVSPSRILLTRASRMGTSSARATGPVKISSAATVAEGRGAAPGGCCTKRSGSCVSCNRTCDAARADVFDYIERFYNPVRRHSTISYLSPIEFEKKAGLA